MKDVEEKKSSGNGGGSGGTGGDDYSLGMAFYRTGMLDEALERFEKSAGRPEMMEASLFYIGMIHFKRGEYRKASEHFKKLLEGNPENISAYNNLAVTLERMGMAKEAELLYHEALKISPLASQVLANIGVCFYRREDYLQAREHLERAVLLNRGVAFASFYLGMTYLKLSMWDEAESHLMSALELSPDNPVIFNNLGVIFRMTGDFQRAIQYAARAMEIDDSISQPYANIDDCLCILGDWEECQRQFDAAIPERDRLVRILIRLGDYYQSKEDFDLAHQIWSRVLEIEPDNRSVKEKIDRLKRPDLEP